MEINATENTTEVHQVGEDAVLFLFTPAAAHTVPEGVQQRLWQMAAWLEPQRETLGLIEIVPGMGNLLLRAERRTLLNSLQDLVLSRWPSVQAVEDHACLIEIPVHYGGDYGPDLEAVAQHCGLRQEALV